MKFLESGLQLRREKSESVRGTVLRLEDIGGSRRLVQQGHQFRNAEWFLQNAVAFIPGALGDCGIDQVPGHENKMRTDAGARGQNFTNSIMKLEAGSDVA